MGLPNTKEPISKSKGNSTHMNAILVVELFGHAGARSGDFIIDLNKSSRPKGAISPLARQMIDAGVNPEARLHIVRDGVSVFKRDRSVSVWAGVDYVDNASQVARRIKYTQFSVASRISDDPSTQPVVGAV